jgi:hypothetical protein
MSASPSTSPVAHLRPGLPVRLVAVERACAGAGLDDHLEPGGRQLRQHLRNEGDTLLIRAGLCWNDNSHERTAFS